MLAVDHGENRFRRAAAFADAVLMDGGQRREGHPRDIHIVKPDDGDVLRHARAALAQPRDDRGGYWSPLTQTPVIAR